MKHHLLKEMRVLAPYMALILLLGAGCLWLTCIDYKPLLGIHLNEHLIFAVGTIGLLTFMGVSLFGSEFADRTMERMLTQPLARRQLWREKLLAMLILVALVFLVELLLSIVAAQTKEKSLLLFSGWDSLFVFFLFVIVGPMQALAVGPFMALHMRQLHTAFWAALIAPVILYFVWLFSIIILHSLNNDLIFGQNGQMKLLPLLGTLVEMIAVYGAAYGLARRKFLRLEV